MTFFVCCFFCITASFGTATTVPNTPFLYTIASDTTDPDNSRIIKIKELPGKKRSKQVHIQDRPSRKKRPKKSSHKNTNRTTSFQLDNADLQKENTIKQNKPNKNQPSLNSEEELRLLAPTTPPIAEQRASLLTSKQCAFAFDHIDEFTGTRKRGLAPRLFFTYTPKQYRQFLKTGDFIRCDGYLSQSSEGGMALNVTLSIASPAAKDKFGDLPPNSNMTLKTMQGKEFFLKSYKGAKATVVGNTTVYECSFLITKSDTKHLATAEVDQVRLRFTKGFQVYEVYYLDFLREQFLCFKH